MTSLKVLISLAALALMGCGTNTVFVYSELPLPVQPVLPVVKSQEFMNVYGRDVMEVTGVKGLPEHMVCMDPDAFDRLVIRETLRKNYANELKAVIEAHNAKAE